MKPLRPFLLLLFLGLFFLLLAYLFPSGEIRIGPHQVIKIPDLRPGSVLKKEEVHYADISKIIKEKREDKPILHDTVSKNVKTIDTYQPVEVKRAIEYPDNTKNALSLFFQSLATLRSSGKSMHILHVGDSQLECDRITDYLRSSLQREFGGSGPGLLPISDDIYRHSVRMKISDNWHRYDLMHAREWKGEKKSLGPFSSLFTFTPITADTLHLFTKETEAWIRISDPGNKNNLSSPFSLCRILYRNHHFPLKTELFAGSVILKSDTINPGRSVRISDFNFEKSPENLEIRFKAAISPEFFAISLESPAGVQVDNIPLRGSAGLDFTEMDPELMKQLVEQLNVTLIILQFGVNVVPTEADNYNYYEKKLYHQLDYLKSLRPDLSIIVISVSDASKKNEQAYESFRNIDKLVEAQGKAAFRAGCAFWNLYEVMGGENSMPSWVLADPTLASPDFIHFNYAGARIVSKMFYHALMNDYHLYTRENK